MKKIARLILLPASSTCRLFPIARPRQAFTALAMLVVLWQVFAPRVSWGIILYGTATRNTSAPTGPLANSGWQYEGQWSSFIGTPIAPQYFIAAKHVSGTVGDTFTLNSVNYTTTAVAYDSTDLVIWKINGTFPASAIAPLYTAAPGSEGGQNLVVFGRGTPRGADVMGGTPSVLHGWLWGAFDGVQSWGENNVDSIVMQSDGTSTGAALKFNFSRTDFNNGMTNEGTLSVGDSSGGVFIQDGSVWKLAGINWVVDGQYSYTGTNGSGFSASLFDRGGFYEGSDGNWPTQPFTDTSNDKPGSSFSTEISPRLAWISSVIGFTWTGGGADGKWSTAANWLSPPTNGVNLVFAGTAGPTNLINDSFLISAGSITFNGGSAAYTLGGTGGGALITISGGITNNSTNTQTVNLNLTLSASQQFNAASGNMAVGGAIATGGSTLTIAGAANTTLSGTISGLGAITKNDGGTLTLSGNNSYSGGTTVSAGTVLVAHVKALGSSTAGPGLTIDGSATVRLQAGLSAPIQLPALTIAGANLSESLVADYGLWNGGSAQQGTAISGTSASSSDEDVQISLSAVPEPATCVLAIAGTAGLVALHRKQRRRVRSRLG